VAKHFLPCIVSLEAGVRAIKNLALHVMNDFDVLYAKNYFKEFQFNAVVDHVKFREILKETLIELKKAKTKTKEHQTELIIRQKAEEMAAVMVGQMLEQKKLEEERAIALVRGSNGSDEDAMALVSS
jgi:hypothetical protein